MRNKWMMGLFLAVLSCLLISGCGKKTARPAATQSPNPNAAITYEKGRDFVGVLTKAEAGTMTFYEPELEKEATSRLDKYLICILMTERRHCRKCRVPRIYWKRKT